MDLFFPYQTDGRGRTREARRNSGAVQGSHSANYSGDDEYIKGLIEQVLFTVPGERVMRPDFGSGLQQLLFSGNSPELAATTQMLVQGALQQWLGNLILVESVSIHVADSTLQVEVTYTINRSQVQQQVTFSRSTTG